MYDGVFAVDFEHLDYHVIRFSSFDGIDRFSLQHIFLIEPKIVSMNVVLCPNFPQITKIYVNDDTTVIEFNGRDQNLIIKSKHMLKHERVDILQLPPGVNTTSDKSYCITKDCLKDAWLSSDDKMDDLSIDTQLFRCSGVKINQAVSASIVLEKYGYRERNDESIDRIFIHVNYPTWAKIAVHHGPLAANPIRDIKYNEVGISISFKDGGEISVCGKSAAIGRVSS
jgi:hypothetical protein